MQEVLFAEGLPFLGVLFIDFLFFLDKLLYLFRFAKCGGIFIDSKPTMHAGGNMLVWEGFHVVFNAELVSEGAGEGEGGG